MAASPRAGAAHRRTGRLSRRAAELVFDLGTRLRRHPGSGKVVILHPGLRKTGTTTIQDMLLANAAALDDHVAALQRCNHPAIDEMHRAGHAFANAPGRDTARLVRRAARRMDAVIRALPQRVVILSDENIAGSRICHAGRDVFDNLADALAIVEQELAGHDTRVALGTRQMAPWTRSCYNQDVKNHKFTGDLDDWICANAACRPHDEGAAHLAARLRSPVAVMPMEDDLTTGRFLGQRLLELAGVPDIVTARLAPAPRSNPSLDDVQLELIREINALDLPYGITARVVGIVQRRRDLLRQTHKVVA